MRFLTTVVGDRDHHVRAALASAIGAIDCKVEKMPGLPLLELLHDPHAEVRAAAVRPWRGSKAVRRRRPLERHSFAIPTLPFDGLLSARSSRPNRLRAQIRNLVDSLRDENAGVRSIAANKLAAQSYWVSDLARTGTLTEQSDVYTSIRRTLADHDAIVRAAAVRLLPRFKSQARESIPLIAARLVDSSPRVRIAAVKALGEFGPLAGTTAPALFDLIQKRDRTRCDGESICSAAARSLDAMRGEIKVLLIRRLVEGLSSGRAQIRE